MFQTEGEAILGRQISAAKPLTINVAVRILDKPASKPDCRRLTIEGRTLDYDRDWTSYFALIARELDSILDTAHSGFKPRVPDLEGKTSSRRYETRELFLERERAFNLHWSVCYIRVSLKTEDRLPNPDEIRLLDDLFFHLGKEIESLQRRIACAQSRKADRPVTRGDA